MPGATSIRIKRLRFEGVFMEANLGTTNLLLGVMAAVSVLEALLLVGTGIALWSVYRRVMELASGLEERQVAPAMLRVQAILDDVKGVTATVKERTVRVDRAFDTAIHRVDDTAWRVRTNVHARTSRIVGFVRGARVALETMLRSRAA
jgi:hypothetical protein